MPSAPDPQASTPKPLSDLSLEHQATLRAVGSGSLVFARYELIRVLGRGGMGVVWLAMDTKLEREVALKFLPDVIGMDAVALGELKNETRRGLELAHPNIVRIYDFLDDEDSAAISMEFVDGQTLSEARLAQPHRVFSTQTLYPWVVQMCEALDYAHQQKKIVHRDLKPANFMVGKDQSIRITDFGIARSVADTLSRLTGFQGGTSGTLLYMSPQQAMGERPNITDDVYSLGATLYELLTGKPPFYTGDISLQMNTRIAPSLQHRREELGVSSEEVIPPSWEAAIAACLDKDPSQRPQSAREFLQRLEFLPIATVPSLEGEPSVIATVPSERSRPQWWIPAAAAVVALPILAFVLWPERKPVDTPTPQPLTPAKASLHLSSHPSGASFILNGKRYTTPADVLDLLPGSYRTELKLPGYQSTNMVLDIEAGIHESPPTVQLVRATGKLTLASTPEGATFEVRSSSKDSTFEPVSGKSPASLDLLPGDYVIAWKVGESEEKTPVSIEADRFYAQNFTYREKALVELPPPPTYPSSPLLGELTPLKELVTPPEALPAPENARDFGPPSPELALAPNNDAPVAATLDDVFVFSRYQTFSPNGQQHILYLAQQELKKKKLYNSALDGHPGQGTHLAIQAFQSEHKLIPTGRLDDTTLRLLELSDQPDVKDWALVKRPSRPRSKPEKAEPDGWWSKNVGGFMKKVFTRP